MKTAARASARQSSIPGHAPLGQGSVAETRRVRPRGSAAARADSRVPEARISGPPVARESSPTGADQSTTAVGPAARAAWLAAVDQGWSDPARLHHEGRRAALLLEAARAADVPFRFEGVEFGVLERSLAVGGQQALACVFRHQHSGIAS